MTQTSGRSFTLAYRKLCAQEIVKCHHPQRAAIFAFGDNDHANVAFDQKMLDFADDLPRSKARSLIPAGLPTVQVTWGNDVLHTMTVLKQCGFIEACTDGASCHQVTE